MARTRILVNPSNPNGIEVPFTAEEEAQADRDASEAIVRKQAEADAKTTKETNRASGKAKLKAGEALNDAELSALFGD
jgi:hypothetical protein